MLDTLAREVFMPRIRRQRNCVRQLPQNRGKVSKNYLITQINRAVTIRSVDRFASRKRIGHSKQTDRRGSGGSFSAGGSLCRVSAYAII